MSFNSEPSGRCVQGLHLPRVNRWTSPGYIGVLIGPFSPPTVLVPLSPVLATLTTPTMAPSNVSLSILPTLSSYPVPYTAPLHHQPCSQQQSISNSLFSSHVHSTPTLALPLFHPHGLLPSSAVLGVDFHTLEPTQSHHSWYSTADPPTQVFHQDVRLPDKETREASAPTHELL